jgi:magnesium-transporting ATPase (P-type)
MSADDNLSQHQIAEIVHASDEDESVNNTRGFHINDRERNKQYKYRSNYIRTTKYSAISFVPLCILQQFKRFANIYFLIIAILQSIKIISPLSPITAILPLVFVIAVSMIREGIEDYMRYRADNGK